MSRGIHELVFEYLRSNTRGVGWSSLPEERETSRPFPVLSVIVNPCAEKFVYTISVGSVRMLV